MSLSYRVTKFIYRPEVNSIEDACLRVLSLCKSKSTEQALCVHSPLIKLALHANLYITNNLISLHGKIHGAEFARRVFDETPNPDVVSWTGLLSACTRDGEHRQALELFDSMTLSGEIPNEFTFSSVLRSCSSVGEFDTGIRVHAYAVKLGHGFNSFLLSSLIDFYAKCGLGEESCKVFGEMDGGGDTVMWTAVISSLVGARKWRRVLQYYGDMIRAHVAPNEVTFVKLLEACCHLGSSYGRLLHAHLVVFGVRLSLILKTAMVDMYSGFRKMEEAVKILHQTPEYDVLLWSNLISGFTRNSRVDEAISSLHEMEILGISPNSFTYSNFLKACSGIPSMQTGTQIHARVIKTGLEAEAMVGNALISMYMKCLDKVDDGLRAFEEIFSPDVISWTSLISGFSEHGFEESSFGSFLNMLSYGIQPNSLTLLAVLRASNKMKSQSQTLKLHGHIIKAKADSDIAIGNALVDAYATLGLVNDAWRVLQTMRRRDTVTYTSLAAQMNKLGHPRMALSVITHMRDDGVKMDGFSLASFLSASASSATLETGKQLHCYAVKSGFGGFASVSNGLIDLYWKCGHEDDGRRAFREISVPDIVSWNALISGLASNGRISSALSAFDDMKLAGFKPDSVTFLSVLFACSRDGLVDLGVEYFTSMKSTYNITPEIDHYICLVDLLGRANQLEDAMEVIATMPFKPDSLIYKTLLCCCRLHRNLPLGEDMARKGLELDPYDPALYLLLANLYDDSGQLDLAKKTRELMKERGLRKSVDQSWIETRNRVQIFSSRDRSHPQRKEIHGKLSSLASELKRQGHSFTDTEGSFYHSERLALAFGLLYVRSNDVIRIVKTMRMCGECHDFVKTVTRLVDRDVIVKEGNRIHTFRNGECLCCRSH